MYRKKEIDTARTIKSTPRGTLYPQRNNSTGKEKTKIYPVKIIGTIKYKRIIMR